MSLGKILGIAASGMHAQTQRLQVVAENIANSSSLPEKPGDEPYRRRVINFRNVLDRTLGVSKVKVGGIDVDHSEFTKRFEPGHPAADEDGFVLTPNVKPLVEMMDMREAQRSYEANLGVVETTRRMLQQTIDVLRT